MNPRHQPSLRDTLDRKLASRKLAGLPQAGMDEAVSIDLIQNSAFEHGMRLRGLGVGIDRLVMLLSNRRSIREVILFPTLRERQ